MDKCRRLRIGGSLRECGTASRAVARKSGIEASHPAASFWLEGGVTAAGTGFSWGHGEIHFRGNDYAFRLSSVSIDNVVAANIAAAGDVLQLRSLAAFSGNYLSSRAGSIESEDSEANYLKNERGVVIKLIARDPALRIHWPVVGMRVKLKRPEPPRARARLKTPAKSK